MQNEKIKRESCGTALVCPACLSYQPEGVLVLDFVCFDVDKGPSAVINCNHQLNITKALMEKSTADVPGQ